MGKKMSFTRKIRAMVTSPYRLFQAICFWMGFSVLLVGILGGIYFSSVYLSLPHLSSKSFDQLKNIASEQTEKKRDSKRKLHWIGIDAISRDFLYAIVMSEDVSFFSHGGVNYEAIAYSLAENIKRKKYAFGGSTISQQVVKNLFLSSRKTIDRKFREIWLTFRLEDQFSKNEILEIYFNVAELGPDIYGVREAAQHYFKKHPSEINAAEGAFIGLMLPSPRRFHYSVFENENLTKTKLKKIKRVLRDMLHHEYISLEQYREYLYYDFYYAKNF